LPIFSSTLWIDRAQRDEAQRERVARLDVRVAARDTTASPALRPVGRKDVALLAVGVVQQRDARVRLGSYSMAATFAGTPTLVALPVDDAVALLVTAAAEAAT
jgi:hypothetical protein